MDITILIAIASTALLLLLGLAYFLKHTSGQKAPENREARQQRGPNRLQAGVPRRAQLARNRARNQQQAQQEIIEDEDEEQDADDIKLPDGKLGAKKRAKLEEKAAKKAQREAEEQQRTEKKKRDQQAESERKKAEEKEKMEEKLREEEEKKAKEEKDRQEYEEYLKMKEAFAVEEEGYEEGEEGDQQNLLQEFVSYIKNNKVVVIEDLAAHFKLKTQAAIDRIKDLQNDNILPGVIDDRGKFIYVSTEEMEAVVKFIKQRGRVSITELAENSNNLINLTPAVVN